MEVGDAVGAGHWSRRVMRYLMASGKLARTDVQACVYIEEQDGMLFENDC